MPESTPPHFFPAGWIKALWRKLIKSRTGGVFTPEARQILALAREESVRFNHNYTGTEHVLLALLNSSRCFACRVLQKSGLDLARVRLEVEKQVGTGQQAGKIPYNDIPYTPRVKKVLALAIKEARDLNHSGAGSEHILLGLLREGEGVAALVLKCLGIDRERTLSKILEELNPNPTPREQEEGEGRS